MNLIPIITDIRASALQMPQPKLPKRYRRIAITREEQRRMQTPAYTPDGGEGLLIILENYGVCTNCGGMTTQRVSQVCHHTAKLDLREKGWGAVVQHYFTECQDCGLFQCS
jgi:hypothetical protein